MYETEALDDFQRYLREEHFDEFKSGDTAQLKQNFATDDEGNIVVGDDEALEDRLQLPEHIRAVQYKDTVFKTYDATGVTPSGLHKAPPA